MLLKRGKNYYCRLWVPIDLRGRVGRTELRKSLRTTDRQSARLAAVQLIHKTELAFSRLRVSMLTDRELEQITVSILADFSSRIEECRKNRKGSFDFLESGLPYGLNINDDSKALPMLEAAFDFPRSIDDAKLFYEGKINELIELKNSGVYRDDFRWTTKIIIEQRGLSVELPPYGWFDINDLDEYPKQPPAEFARIHDAIIDGLLESYSLELQRVQGVKNPAIEAAVVARIEAAKHRPKLSELWDAYKSHKHAKGRWGESTADGYERFYNDTVGILGDRELSDYNGDDATRLLNALKENAASTATGKIEFVSSLFKWALKTPDSQERWGVRGNPFTEMQVLATDESDDVGRVPYTDDDLHNLVTGLLDVRKLVEPHRFWVPLLALYTGARQNDICQLRVADLVEIDGVLMFKFCHNPALQQTTKSRKTRTCPVHPMLFKLGFGVYVEQQRANGHDMLFHTLDYSKGKKWTGRIRTWWNETYQMQHVTDLTGKSFHSMRHNFISRFKHTGCYENANDRAVMQSMVGHIDGDVTAGYEGGDYSPKVKLKLLAKMDYGFDMELIGKLRGKQW